MKHYTKPLLIAKSGLAVPISSKAWSNLLAGMLPMLVYANQTAKAILAFMHSGPNELQTIQLLQSVLLDFDSHGIPLSWNMSHISLERPCPLHKGAKLRPRRSKFYSEQNFWYPSQSELEFVVASLLKLQHVRQRTPIPTAIPQFHGWRIAASTRVELQQR